MTGVKWTIKAREFVNCNCAYGCPCQFDALPTHGNCQAVAGMQIDEGHHGDTRLDGLRFVGIFRWPGAIHEGKGEAAVIIDERASEAQRGALLRILSGQDTEPGATIFQVFSTTLEKVYEPIFAPIDFDVDIDARKGRLVVRGVTEGRGEPIKSGHRRRPSRPDRYTQRLRVYPCRNGARMDYGVASDADRARQFLRAIRARQSLPERHRALIVGRVP